ncbi:MAG: hypothetical protein EOP45_18475 [Sphingobacteriaceae bacterium]|nr:MAG: hypothetical protein EOP45_18475 [Sphingobacteriaceae bacterium]
MKINFKISILRQPYNLFLLAALLLFLFSFFTLGRTLDFMLHDTYFVVSTIAFIWFLTFINLFLWTIYSLIHKILWTKFLTWFHVITSLIVLLVLVTLAYRVNPTVELRREYVAIQALKTEQQMRTLIIVVMTMIFIGGQLAFAINLVGGFTKKLLTK